MYIGLRQSYTHCVRDSDGGAENARLENAGLQLSGTGNMRWIGKAHCMTTSSFLAKG